MSRPPISRRLVEPEPFAGRDPELVGDQVATRHELGHRVLDLEARVHFEEGRLAAIVDEELARAGTHIADPTRERQGRRSEPGAKDRVHPR